MPTGRQFRIRSVLNGLYLVADQGQGQIRMQNISEKELHHDRVDALWYQDCLTVGVRSALSNVDLCIDSKETGELCISTYVVDKSTQQLIVTGDVIRSQIDQTIVVAINGDDVLEGDGLAMCPYTIGDVTQKFEFIYEPARYFRICCDKNKAIDVNDDNNSLFVTVIGDDPATPTDSQLFYMDKYSTICSKRDHKVLDSSDKRIHLSVFEPGKPEHLWTFSSDRIVNSTRPSKVLTVKGTKHEEGASLVSTKYNGDLSQKWSLDYVTE